MTPPLTELKIAKIIISLAENLRFIIIQRGPNFCHEIIIKRLNQVKDLRTGINQRWKGEEATLILKGRIIRFHPEEKTNNKKNPRWKNLDNKILNRAF